MVGWVIAVRDVLIRCFSPKSETESESIDLVFSNDTES